MVASLAYVGEQLSKGLQFEWRYSPARHKGKPHCGPPDGHQTMRFFRKNSRSDPESADPPQAKGQGRFQTPQAIEEVADTWRFLH